MTINCRLCEGSAEHVFDRIVLGTHTVEFFKCSQCNCLQSEQPYWLEEAYAGGNLTDADTGPVVRSLNSQALIFAVAKILGLPASAAIVDFGGGVGLLTRLLRDQGFDARWFDTYARNDLARGFEDGGSPAEIICSFEVAEHLVRPADELAVLFRRGARLIIIGTETFRGQGPDWWYLAPHSGQHIFFYSPKGMAFLGKLFGYHYERVGSIHLFLDRPMTRLQSALLWRAISPFWLRIFRAWLAFRLTNVFAARDSDNILKS